MGISDDFHNFIAKAGDLASSASEIGSQKMKDLENTATGIKAREAMGGLTKASKEHLDNFEKSGIHEKFRNIATEKRSEIAERVREMEQSHLATKARERGLELAGYGKQKLREVTPRALREALVRRVHRFRSSAGKVFGNGRAARAIWKLFRGHPVREGGLVFLMIYPAFLWMPVLGILGWGADGVNSGPSIYLQPRFIINC